MPMRAGSSATKRRPYPTESPGATTRTPATYEQSFIAGRRSFLNGSSLLGARPYMAMPVRIMPKWVRGPRTHFGMIRTGIAMYGLAPSNDDPFKDDLRPAMKLCSYVAGVRVVAPGDSVGYGRRFVADEPARIGIVPAGYADGVSRLLASRGNVLVAGRRCRITGTISMDQLTVRLPDDWGRPGDEVVFFGAVGDGVEGRAGEAWTGAAGPRRDAPGAPRILCEEVAHLLQTINYEVACDVAPRGVRRYRGGGCANSGSGHARGASRSGPRGSASRAAGAWGVSAGTGTAGVSLRGAMSG